MDNASANLKPSRMRAALLSSGGLLFGVWFCFAFYYPSFLADAVGVIAASLILFFAGLFSAALVPIAYLAVNRIRSGFWGRYHFTLAAATLFAALSCALLFCGESWHYAARIVCACICLPLTTVLTVSIAYIAYSINARVCEGESGVLFFRALFSLLGTAIGAVLTLLPELGLGRDAVGYGGGCLILLTGLLLYFSSVGFLPRFVRPLSRKVTVKTLGEEFLKKRTPHGILLAVGFAASVALAAAALGFLPLQTAHAGFALPFAGGLLAATGVALAAAAYLICRKRRAENIAFVAVGCVCSLIGAAGAAVILVLLPLSETVNYVLLCVAFAFVGAGCGLSLSPSKAAFERACEIFSGVNYCFEMMLAIVSSGVGFAVSAVLESCAVLTAAIVFGATAVALAAIELTCAVLGRKMKEKAASRLPSDADVGR